jgi:hypothetical protein
MSEGTKATEIGVSKMEKINKNLKVLLDVSQNEHRMYLDKALRLEKGELKEASTFTRFKTEETGT